MDVFIKFKLSLAGGAEITDSSGKVIYLGKGKVFSPFRQKRLCSLDGKTLYTIRNKFFHIPFTKTALVKTKDGLVAKLRRSISLTFTVKKCEHEILIKGGKLNGSMTIFKDGVEMASVANELSINGKFIVNITDPADAEFVIALLLAVNNIRKNK